MQVVSSLPSSSPIAIRFFLRRARPSLVYSPSIANPKSSAMAHITPNLKFWKNVFKSSQLAPQGEYPQQRILSSAYCRIYLNPFDRPTNLQTAAPGILQKLLPIRSTGLTSSPRIPRVSRNPSSHSLIGMEQPRRPLRVRAKTPLGPLMCCAGNARCGASGFEPTSQNRLMSEIMLRAKLSDANLIDTDLTDAKLKRAKFANTTIPDGSIRTN